MSKPNLHRCVAQLIGTLNNYYERETRKMYFAAVRVSQAEHVYHAPFYRDHFPLAASVFIYKNIFHINRLTLA